MITCHPVPPATRRAARRCVVKQVFLHVVVANAPMQACSARCNTQPAWFKTSTEWLQI